MMEGIQLNRATLSKSREKLYKRWANMKNRCYNKNNDKYKFYGGRGIVVCDLWKNSFLNFKEWCLQSGYSDDLTLDRIDNNGIYSPDNCRWVTMKVQNSNKRRNVLIPYNGEILTLTQLAEKSAVNFSALRARIKSGWEINKAVNTPFVPQCQRWESKKIKMQQLLNFWRKHNYRISKAEAKEMIGINHLFGVVKNLKEAGVPVMSERRWDLNEHFARYYLKCTCRIVGGEQVTDGCYVHSADLKL